MSKSNADYYFKKERIGLVAVSMFAVLLLAGAMSQTFAGIVANITNSANRAITGSLEMTEKNADASVTCKSSNDANNTASCSTINKYGSETEPLAPGVTRSTNISISNSGTIEAKKFTLTGGACSQEKTTTNATFGTATNLCEKVNVKISSNGTTIFEGTAKAFQDAGATNILAKLSKTSVAAGENIPLTVAITLNQNVDASYQNLRITQPMTWQFEA